jgi:hypothetical protein
VIVDYKVKYYLRDKQIFYKLFLHIIAKGGNILFILINFSQLALALFINMTLGS